MGNHDFPLVKVDWPQKTKDWGLHVSYAIEADVDDKRNKGKKKTEGSSEEDKEKSAFDTYIFCAL